jgi:hypothetical protein
VSFLLDTNVWSELRKGRRCDPGVASWLSAVDDADLFLSVLVVAEIRSGVERIRRRDASAALSLDAWLRTLQESHTERILPVDLRVAEEWGRMASRLSVPVVDGLLAATALVHGLTLVTRNVKDVARTGASVLNPFSDRR